MNSSPASNANFSADETARYARHLVMPEVTKIGQEKLRAARVLCLGAGGLGSPAALYLAAAGVGTLGLVDDDRVDLSNLQRQLLHGTNDIGRAKVESARDRLHKINPHVNVIAHEVRFRSDNATEITRAYDIVLDGSDNFATRYLSNDVCVFQRKPNIYGSVFRFDGQTSVFAPHLGGPCYRCLFPEPPPPGAAPNCAEAGVLGVLPGIIGTLQALEAIKLIIGIGTSMIGRLLHFDALQMKFREFQLRRDPECPVCGTNPSIREPIDYEEFCSGAREPNESKASLPAISVHALKQKLDAKEKIELIDVREPFENELCQIDGGRLIPLGEIVDRVDEIPRDRDVIVYCKSGARSAQAVGFLQRSGFARVFNLTGGIEAWSDEIDPTIPKY